MAAFTVLRNPALDAGMVASYPVNILPQDQGITRKLYNFDFDEIPGVLRKRFGTRRLFELLPSACKGAVQFLAEGITPIYVAAASNKVYRELNEEWIEIQPEGWIHDSATTCEFVSILGLLIISDGVNPSFSWNGTEVTVLEEMPKGNLMAELRNRVFVAGITEDPIALRGSHVGDPTLWSTTDPGSNAFMVYPGGDGAITSILTVDDTLLIGKKYSLHMLVGTTIYDFQVIPIDKNIGVGSHRSVKSIRGAAYFVSSEGEIFRLESGARPERISSGIQDYTRQVNLSRIHEARAAVMEKYHYVITLPVGEVDFVTLVYDVMKRRWREFDLHMGATAVSPEVLGYCFTKPDGRQFFQLDPMYKTDEEEAIDSYFETLEYHCGFPETEKEINNLWLGVWCSDEEYYLFVEANRDGQGWKTLTPSGVLVKGNKNDYKRIRIPVQEVCHNIQFRVRNSGLGDSVRILDMILTFIPKEME